MKTKIIIAGCRTFEDYDVLEKIVDCYLDKNNLQYRDIKIISGHAKGADKLGEKYAEKHNIELEIYKANWNKYGKKAGAIRNGEMARNANRLIAFWDFVSKGTANMIETAQKRKLFVDVYDIRKGGVM